MPVGEPREGGSRDGRVLVTPSRRYLSIMVDMDVTFASHLREFSIHLGYTTHTARDVIHLFT